MTRTRCLKLKTTCPPWTSTWILQPGPALPPPTTPNQKPDPNLTKIIPLSQNSLSKLKADGSSPKRTEEFRDLCQDISETKTVDLPTFFRIILDWILGTNNALPVDEEAVTAKYIGKRARKSFHLFSSLTVTSDTFRLDLTRDETFPANRLDTDKKRYSRDKRFVATDPPANADHLELELGEEMGSGGTGVVYSARVSNQNSDETLPSELVVKFARLNHCRNLAREAWVYERMATRTKILGSAAPRCYGFFTTKLPACYRATSVEDTNISRHGILTYEKYVSLRPKYPWMFRSYDEHRERDDELDDDRGFPPLQIPELEQPRFKDLSPWNKWKPDLNDPLIAVLVLDKGGPSYTHDDDQDPDVRLDVQRLLQDFQVAGIGHGDYFRMPHVVRAPSQTAMCPNHNVIHKWSIIDFNRCWVVDFALAQHVRYAMALVKPIYRGGTFFN
ncbi:hypothetical protein D9757_008424 [Collybiopsis confluens]|uniref:Protein kinase domain-containing protein n=1 Tax=Collybiopsis confluens TaxID=2823264 RepID=A0A8H5HHL2_9AGAR|nr:hypothetical protein D9757_008424 [Collybiopsis confluens]